LQKIVNISSGKKLSIMEMEPEILYSFHGHVREERTVVHLDDVPDHLLDAIVCAEDFRFFKHHGVDVPGIMRALLVNLKSMRVVQGGSTITQQLIKNLYLTEERTLKRKIKEGLMAFMLDAKYPKRKILEVYLNEIYLGQRESVSICGVGEASRFYFGKDADNLNLSESAMLAGMIPSPGSYNPFTNYEKSIQKRNQILSLMHSKKMISEEEYQKAILYKLHLRGRIASILKAPYFVDFLREQLLDLYREEVLQKEGLRIFTTLDPFLQSSAEESVRSGLEALEKRFLNSGKDQEALEACLISLQPQTGHIMAMVGGRDYGQSQFNRLTQAHRQPGSLFKPFTYLTAFSRSQEKQNSKFTALTLLEDEPFTLRLRDRDWKPQNYDGIYRGTVTARQALEESLNVPTVRLSQELGMEAIIETARKCGVHSSLIPLPSLALGAQEVTPLEMAAAYSSIANLGKKTVPLSIRDVVDLDGNIIVKRRIEMKQVVSSQASYLITDILKGAVERGTAQKLKDYGFKGIAAGKTGTTNDFKDSWFVGYTPQLLTLVWIGYDSNKSTGLSGASGAMRLWANYMERIGHLYGLGSFPIPPGLIYVEIDSRDFKKLDQAHRGVKRELFIEGTKPQGIGEDFKNRIKGWWKKIFKKEKE
jgi:penicillin-binding protein 1B